MVSVIVGCVCGYDSVITNSQVMARVLGWFPYYYLGTMINKDQIEKLACNIKNKMVGISIVLLWGIICLVYRKNIMDMMF